MPAVRFSRYEFAEPHEDECGRTFLDVPDPLPKRVRPDDVRVVVGLGDTLHTLAWRRFEAIKSEEEDIRPTSLFDVIAESNDVVDADQPLEPGTVIRIPSIRAVLEEIRVPPPFFRRSTTL